jgi:hypothetical protein
MREHTPAGWSAMEIAERLALFVQAHTVADNGTESIWEAGYQECLGDIATYVIDGAPLPEDDEEVAS